MLYQNDILLKVSSVCLRATCLVNIYIASAHFHTKKLSPGGPRSLSAVAGLRPSGEAHETRQALHTSDGGRRPGETGIEAKGVVM